MSYKDYLNRTQFYTQNLPSSLNIKYRPHTDQLGESESSRGWPQDSTESVSPDTPIYTSQQRYDPKQVMHYLKGGAPTDTSFGNNDRPQLNDFGAGRTWHQDGLHRMIASRLSHQQFDADITRKEQWDD